MRRLPGSIPRGWSILKVPVEYTPPTVSWGIPGIPRFLTGGVPQRYLRGIWQLLRDTRGAGTKREEPVLVEHVEAQIYT